MRETRTLTPTAALNPTVCNPDHVLASVPLFQRRRRRRRPGCRCPPAFSAQAFVLLDLLLMIVAFAAVQSGDAVLVACSFGLHYLAALTVRVFVLLYFLLSLCVLLFFCFHSVPVSFSLCSRSHEPRFRAVTRPSAGSRVAVACRLS